MCAPSHLEPLGAAGHGGEDVVGVHGAQDEVAARPRLQAAAKGGMYTYDIRNEGEGVSGNKTMKREVE